MNTLPVKMRFLEMLVRCLHRYGASTYRLEEAVLAVSRDLKLECDLFSGPTSCFLTVREAADHVGRTSTTRVLRMEPGSPNLARLSLADEIATRVSNGRLRVEDGVSQLEAIDRVAPEAPRWQQVLAYGISSAAVAAMLGSSALDMLAACLVSWVIGWIATTPGRLQSQGSVEAVAATVAAVLAIWIEHFLPISRQVVIMVGLIVLMPGLSLTTAMAELATNHLVAGSARLAGATMTLLKLTFGVVLGTYIGESVGWLPAGSPLEAVPLWVQWAALPVASWAFVFLFHARRRDLWASILAAMLGYVIARISTVHFGSDFGVFVAAFVVASMGNLFSRIWQRPASLVRVPGIILLVPGSLGFRGVVQMFEKDTLTSLGTGLSMIVVLASLVAGLLFGNVLVAPRRSV